MARAISGMPKAPNKPKLTEYDYPASDGKPMAETVPHFNMITYLAISHGHADHVANANEYSRSTVLIQSKEWDFIFSEAQRKELLTRQV